MSFLRRRKARLTFRPEGQLLPPLLVYQNDLIMRGYAGYCGPHHRSQREDGPIGEKAYLAVRTDDLKALIKDLNLRMHAYVINAYREQGTYALISIAPLTPLR